VTARLNATLVRTVVAAALGGSLLGFDTAVISGTTQSLTRVFALSPAELGLTVSAALWGTVAGALGAGLLGRRWGGRTSLMILAACYLISALGCAFSHSWDALLIFRFVGGLGMGGSSVIAPVYIAEVSPVAWRGRLVGAFQINIIAGILLAYLSNYVLGLLTLGESEWRWQLGVAAAPAAIFLTTLIGIPQSARWLAARGRLEDAQKALRRLGAPVEAELAAILRALREGDGANTQGLFQWRYRRPLILAVVLAAFNQLIGINAVLYYLNDIFAMAGFDRASQNFQAVAVGAVMLLATLIAMAAIDRLGRRTLLLIGSVGLALCLAGIATIFHTHRHENVLLVLLIGYISFFAFSQGAVIWVYLSEIFPSRVRAQGQSLGSSTHWIMNALVSVAFPVVAAQSQAGPFLVFLVIVLLQFVVVLLFFPETTGVSLEDMEKRMCGASIAGAENWGNEKAPADTATR
jgi:MFS transporter, SP family, arabinose:H+ symporter